MIVVLGVFKLQLSTRGCQTWCQRLEKAQLHRQESPVIAERNPLCSYLLEASWSAANCEESKGPLTVCVCVCVIMSLSPCAKAQNCWQFFGAADQPLTPPDIIGVSSTMLHLFLSFSYKVHLTANRLWMMCFLLDYVITHSRLEQLESFCYFKHSTIMLWFCCFPLLWKGLTDCMIDINNIHIYLCQTFQIRSCTILSKISAFTNIWPWVRSHS